MPTKDTPVREGDENGVDWIELVRTKVQGLRYGVVQLVVHDGRVTQIDRTEKTRLPAGPDAPSRAG